MKTQSFKAGLLVLSCAILTAPGAQASVLHGCTRLSQMKSSQNNALACN